MLMGISGTLKSREWKTRHQIAGGGGENRGRRKSMESEGFKYVFLAILTENRVMILACLAHRVEIDSNVTAAHSWAE